MQILDNPMTDASGQTGVKKEKPTDPAVESGLERLTPERIRDVITQVLEKETGPRFKAYVETCMRCGMCADACSYFLSNDRNPRFMPAAKVKNTIWEMLAQRGNVSRDFLREAVRISHLECNVCKRCAMY
ncbi:MAG: 4Fe-4S dicluster domain-containing protein, partial [Desulfotignum sp.]